LAAEGLDTPAGGGDGDGDGDGDGPNSNRRRAALPIRSLTPVVTGVGERSRHQFRTWTRRKLASGIGNGDAEASRCNTSTGGAFVVAGVGAHQSMRLAAGIDAPVVAGEGSCCKNSNISSMGGSGAPVVVGVGGDRSP